MTGIPRVLPVLDETNSEFWTSGFSGRLHITRCNSCRTWIHPPAPVCRACLSGDVAGAPVSGKATVLTYTVNRHQWGPDENVPYVVAIVELPEQEGLRLTTNIVNCPVDEVHAGMAVRVLFEKADDVALPLFEPDR